MCLLPTLLLKGSLVKCIKPGIPRFSLSFFWISPHPEKLTLSLLFLTQKIHIFVPPPPQHLFATLSSKPLSPTPASTLTSNLHQSSTMISAPRNCLKTLAVTAGLLSLAGAAPARPHDLGDTNTVAVTAVPSLTATDEAESASSLDYNFPEWPALESNGATRDISEKDLKQVAGRLGLTSTYTPPLR